VREIGTWLKTTLVTAARAAVRVMASYLHAQFVRLKARRGAKTAILAVAAAMLTRLPSRPSREDSRQYPLPCSHRPSLTRYG
jgi:transposase